MYKNRHYDLFIEQLNKVFPNKNTLTKKDIIEYDGRSRNTVMKAFPELRQMKNIDKVAFALILAKRAEGLT